MHVLYECKHIIVKYHDMLILYVYVKINSNVICMNMYRMSICILFLQIGFSSGILYKF